MEVKRERERERDGRGDLLNELAWRTEGTRHPQAQERKGSPKGKIPVNTSRGGGGEVTQSGRKRYIQPGGEREKNKTNEKAKEQRKKKRCPIKRVDLDSWARKRAGEGIEGSKVLSQSEGRIRAHGVPEWQLSDSSPPQRQGKRPHARFTHSHTPPSDFR